MNQPHRAALLINSQSAGAYYLRGVSQDSLNFKNYLMSPVGGAFYENEIIVLNNPTCSTVIETLSRLNSHYLLTHVSSHGYCHSNGDRIVCLKDGDLSVGHLINYSPKQLVLIDACGNIVERGAKIGAIEWHSDEFLYFEGFSLARYWLDNWIATYPDGKMIICGSSLGQLSYEDQTRIGGQFTLSLLDSMEWRQNSGKEEYVSMDTVLRDSRLLLQQKHHIQIPQVLYRDVNFDVPLGVISPQFKKLPAREILQQEPQKDYSGFILASLLVLGAVVISNK